MPNKQMNFGTDILPVTDSTYVLGTSSYRFADVQTDEINGTVVPNNPAFTDTTYSAMTGASSSTAGTSGLVPAPSAGDQEKVLSGAGTWVNQSGGTSATVASGTLAAGSWTSATPPTQTISVTGVTANNIIVVSIASTATSAQFDAAAAGKLLCTAQAANSITMTCYGTTPTENIPLSVLILG